MNYQMSSQIIKIGGFDQLAVERAVYSLSRTGVRSPLSVERIKQWSKQFHSDEEKTLACLILRNLIFRTNEQLLSSMRQALKQATIHFIQQLGLGEKIAWTDAIKGAAGLTFYCGPPSLPSHGFTQPGKSGELVARLTNQRYGLDKQYPSDISTLEKDDRFLIVDDGAYTGVQLVQFLRAWGADLSSGRVAIAVAIAHKGACEFLANNFPAVPIFYGELLTEESCFKAMAQKWIETEQWLHEQSPIEVYEALFNRNKPFKHGGSGDGYGGVGALVAFEHGVPDDSIQLLWDVSPTWKPLVDR